MQHGGETLERPLLLRPGGSYRETEKDEKKKRVGSQGTCSCRLENDQEELRVTGKPCTVSRSWSLKQRSQKGKDKQEANGVPRCGRGSSFHTL